jgi:predicted membrane-bound spermidine synthase
MSGERSLGANRIGAAFFLSGFAALVYQVAWQRLLFIIVGVDIESITIIVSTFMLGLGVGAAIGGIMADRFPQRILVTFCLFEAFIAGYGSISAHLLISSGHLFSGLGHPAAAGLSFLLLLLPTMCMGATLPMLIANAFRTSGNVGVSTGTLYFINTLGAAAGSLAVGFFLLYWLDIGQTIRVAVGMNLTASAIVASALVWK